MTKMGMEMDPFGDPEGISSNFTNILPYFAVVSWILFCFFDLYLTCGLWDVEFAQGAEGKNTSLSGRLFYERKDVWDHSLVQSLDYILV